MGGGRNTPLLTELENVLGCVSTEISPLTGPGNRAGCAGTPPRPGGFFLIKFLAGAKSKFVKRKNHTSVPSVAFDMERGFEHLIRSQDWRRLAKMPGVADAFNVFQVLDNAGL